VVNLNKYFIDIIVFVCAIITTGVYLFTSNILSFGFSMLFCIMFITDSLTYMFKKKVFNKGPIGGDLWK
jgi:hypothetical protein